MSSAIDISKTFAIGSNSEMSGYPRPVSHFETVLSETFNFPQVQLVSNDIFHVSFL